MALLGLLVLLALAGPVGGTWDSCRGTCGLRPLDSDHSPAAGTSHVGGTSVQPGAWPGIVSIQATWENGTWHMCTGVLLSSQWVLTVAHCFARARGISMWDVVIGATDLRQPGPEAVVRRIQRLLVHQHYVAATARNDIALVELDQPVECSDHIQLGCVPDASLRVSELKSCYIAGWNFARTQGTGMVLQESKVHLMDTELCNSSRWYAGAVHADNLCAGYPHGAIDTCQGDSGGPLVCKDNRADYYWLVGLNSWGRGCDRARHPGIYTSTQHFYNWILIQTSLSPADIRGTAPEPNCAPTPEPEVTMTSEETPTPGPEPEEETTPVPEPRPELVVPGPELTPEPMPEVELVTDTASVPEPDLEAELVPEPEPEPEPTPEPELMPEPEPVPEPTPEPELMPEPEPVPPPTPEPELVPEPTPVPVLDQMSEPTPEPTTAPTTEPTTVPVPEPSLVPESTVEPEPTPEPEQEPELVPEPEPELVPEPEPELVPEQEPELVPEPEPELVPEPEPELVPEPEPELVPEPEPELVPEPEPEPEPTIPPMPEEPAPTPEPEPAPDPDRLLLISVPYQSLVQFCNLLRDFLQFLRDQLG